MMRNRSGFTFVLAAAALLGFAGAAHAAGFLIYDLTGEALGKASAVTASTTEPAAVWFNPASLAYQPNGVSVSSVLVVARSRFEPAEGGDEVKSKLGRFVLPSAFASVKVADRVAVAFGAFPAFGLSLAWPSDWLGRDAAIKATIETVTLNPTVSVAILPQLSLAAGFQAVRGSVEFLSGIPQPVGGTALLGGGAWGYGGNIGLLYRPLPERLHFAFTYRSRVKLKFKGRVDFDPSPDFEPSLPDQGGSAEITLPDILSLGSMWRPTPTVTLTFDPNLVLWNTYDKLAIDFDTAPDRIMQRNNHAAITLRFGAEWATPAPGLSLRTGFIFDQNPSPKNTLSPTLPDANRLDFAAGVGYRWHGLRADLGYLLVYFLPSHAEGGTEGPVGTYKSIAHLLGLTLSAQFGH